jgi:exopolysaccharide biosynthesis polyprenyl glycosylphosphotransferase
MIKPLRKSHLLIQYLFDAFSIFLSWLLAFTVRLNLPEAELSFELFFFQLLPLILALSFIFFHRQKLYLSIRFSAWYREVGAIFLANLQAGIAFVVILYFFSPYRISRATILLYLVFSEIVIVLFRIVERNILIGARRRGYNLQHVIIVGNGYHVTQYVERVLQMKESGLRVMGWADSLGQAAEFGIPQIESADIESLLAEYRPDGLIIGYENHQSSKLQAILERTYNSVVPVVILPDLAYSFIGTTVEDFAGVPLIMINQPEEKLLERMVKRLFDIFASLAGLVALSPFLFAIYLAIRLSSPGPALYKQERLTVNGRRFWLHKFRTMSMASDGSNETGWTVKDDPRVTRVGAFLRRTSIDELPQLWNIIKGEMSLVGPRPEREMYVDRFKQEIPAYMLRLKMKAGLTGWAQVNGWRGNTSIEKRLEYDLYYIRNWSFFFDLRIIFLTFMKGFVNRNAY